MQALLDANWRLTNDHGVYDEAERREAHMYLVSKAPAVVERLYEDRAVLANIAKSSHHGADMLSPYVVWFQQICSMTLMCVHLDPTCLTAKASRASPAPARTRSSCSSGASPATAEPSDPRSLIIDLDENNDELAEFGTSIYEAWQQLVCDSQKTCQCCGDPDREPLDMSAAFEDFDAFTLALGRHLEQPILAVDALMAIATLQCISGSDRSMAALGSPDLGLAKALVDNGDMLVQTPIPDPSGRQTAYGFVINALSEFLKHPYALRECVKVDLFDKLARSGLKLAGKAPETTAKLLKVIAETLKTDDRLLADCETERAEAVKIALAGLKKMDKLKSVRQAWTELGQLRLSGASGLAMLWLIVAAAQIDSAAS